MFIGRDILTLWDISWGSVNVMWMQKLVMGILLFHMLIGKLFVIVCIFSLEVKKPRPTLAFKVHVCNQFLPLLCINMTIKIIRLTIGGGGWREVPLAITSGFASVLLNGWQIVGCDIVLAHGSDRNMFLVVKCSIALICSSHKLLVLHTGVFGHWRNMWAEGVTSTPSSTKGKAYDQSLK